MASVFGAEFRRVENREHLGKPALVAVAERSYDTSVEDLWDAIMHFHLFELLLAQRSRLV